MKKLFSAFLLSATVFAACSCPLVVPRIAVCMTDQSTSVDTLSWYAQDIDVIEAFRIRVVENNITTEFVLNPMKLDRSSLSSLPGQVCYKWQRTNMVVNISRIYQVKAFSVDDETDWSPPGLSVPISGVTLIK